MIDRRYLEEAARVALSLTKEIMEQQRHNGCVSLDAIVIVIGNVIVSDTKLGEAIFVTPSDVGGHSHSTSSLCSERILP